MDPDFDEWIRLDPDLAEWIRLGPDLAERIRLEPNLLWTQCFLAHQDISLGHSEVWRSADQLIPPDHQILSGQTYVGGPSPAKPAKRAACTH